MQRITPNIWFDNEAEEAANLYTSVFRNGTVGRVLRYDQASAEAARQPEGSALTVEFEIEGVRFVGLNGGPQFKPNPSISFLVAGKTRKEVDELWIRLSEDGSVLMPLGQYPFSEHYGWTADRYNVSWQIMLVDDHYPFRHKITPTLMYVRDVCGKAEEAIEFYASVFPESNVGDIARYPAGMGPDREGTVMHGSVTLFGQEFFAMDSAQPHEFSFSEGVSFIIDCGNQEEVDHFWEKLTAGGGAESMCGWLEDRFGVSWQVVPRRLMDMIAAEDRAKAGRAIKAMLGMKKIRIAELEKAFEAG